MCYVVGVLELQGQPSSGLMCYCTVRFNSPKHLEDEDSVELRVLESSVLRLIPGGVMF